VLFSFTLLGFTNDVGPHVNHRVVHDVVIAAGRSRSPERSLRCPCRGAPDDLGYSINDTIVVFDVSVRTSGSTGIAISRRSSTRHQQTEPDILTSFTVFSAITALFVRRGEARSSFVLPAVGVVSDILVGLRRFGPPV